jgi:hypothetical protein
MTFACSEPYRDAAWFIARQVMVKTKPCNKVVTYCVVILFVLFNQPKLEKEVTQMFTAQLNLSLTITLQREEVAIPIVHVKVDGKNYRCFLAEEEIIAFKDKTELALYVIRNGQRIM